MDYQRLPLADAPEPDMDVSDLTFENIAGLENVLTSVPYFIISDNIDNTTRLEPEYIKSIQPGIMNRPFKIRFNMMMFCLSGGMDIQMNLQKHRLRPGSMLTVFEGTICESVSLDPESKLFFIGFSRLFVKSYAVPYKFGAGLSQLFKSPIVELSPRDFDDMKSLYMIAKTRFSSPNFTFKEKLAHTVMETMGCILLDMMTNAAPEGAPRGRRQMLVREFMTLVEKEATVHRDIAYYANRLSITPKYLSQIVSDVTGATPHALICRQVMLEAKVLLADPRLNIQQVSDRLHFANPSFFGTFFRKHTGITPGAYRSGAHNDA